MAKQLIKDRKEIKRIHTGIEGFDEITEGGIPESTVTLFAGKSGTMKSSLAFNVLYNEVLHKNSNGMYISLEQSSTSLLNHMIALGFDLSKVNLVILSDIGKLDEAIKTMLATDEGVMIVTDVGAIRKQLGDVKRTSPNENWMNALLNLTLKIDETEECKVLILDSLAALYSLAKMDHPRTELYHLFEFFRERDITSLLISEMHGDDDFGEYNVEDFLADGILHITRMEKSGKTVRGLRIVKMRQTKCDLNLFQFERKGGKFRVFKN